MSKADSAELFAALGDPIRLALIGRLADGEPRSIAALGSGSALSRQALTKHLRVLERIGAVSSARFGREVRFRIEREKLAEAEAFLTRITRQWSSALGRLKELTER
jgi:DNA-binding transcriptional ArsR family regulator